MTIPNPEKSSSLSPEKRKTIREKLKAFLSKYKEWLEEKYRGRKLKSHLDFLRYTIIFKKDVAVRLDLKLPPGTISIEKPGDLVRLMNDFNEACLEEGLISSEDSEEEGFLEKIKKEWLEERLKIERSYRKPSFRNMESSPSIKIEKEQKQEELIKECLFYLNMGLDKNRILFADVSKMDDFLGIGDIFMDVKLKNGEMVIIGIDVTTSVDKPPIINEFSTTSSSFPLSLFFYNISNVKIFRFDFPFKTQSLDKDELLKIVDISVNFLKKTKKQYSGFEKEFIEVIGKALKEIIENSDINPYNIDNLEEIFAQWNSEVSKIYGYRKIIQEAPPFLMKGVIGFFILATIRNIFDRNIDNTIKEIGEIINEELARFLTTDNIQS